MIFPLRKNDWSNAEIEERHDEFHKLFKTRGGNFHWSILVRILCPRLLNAVSECSKVGRFVEAWCQSKGRSDAMCHRVMELHHQIFVAFEMQLGNHHFREALTNWQRFIREELALENFIYDDGTVWKPEPSGWWEFQLNFDLDDP